MPSNVYQLIELAKSFPTTAEQREELRRSFVYGNTAIENPNITRKIVNDQADKMNENSNI